MFSKKNLLIFACCVLLVFSMTGVAGAAVWTDGVTLASGWLDADKTFVDDTQLCWSASASNILSYTGWDGGPTLSTEDQIFNDFKAYWNDDVGNPYYGVEWWFTGTNGQQGTAGWAQLTDTTHAGFYSSALFSANFSWNTYGSNLTGVEGYLSANRGVSIRIESSTGYGHFLTVWGADATTNEIWVTDSDLNLDTLDHYTLTGANLDGAYNGWFIESYYGLLQNSDGVEPTPRNGQPVPEPATFLLFGSCLLAISCRKKLINSS